MKYLRNVPTHSKKVSVSLSSSSTLKAHTGYIASVFSGDCSPPYVHSDKRGGGFIGNNLCLEEL